MNLNRFKAYDITGRVPDGLREDLTRRVGMTTVTLLDAGPGVTRNGVRLRIQSLQAAFAAGMQAAARDVIDIGLCGTEEVYFQNRHLKGASDIMVTTSHKPTDNHNFSLVREDAHPIKGDSGLFALIDHTAGTVVGGDLAPGAAFRFSTKTKVANSFTGQKCQP